MHRGPSLLASEDEFTGAFYIDNSFYTNGFFFQVAPQKKKSAQTFAMCKLSQPKVLLPVTIYLPRSDA